MNSNYKGCLVAFVYLWEFSLVNTKDVAVLTWVYGNRLYEVLKKNSLAPKPYLLLK